MDMVARSVHNGWGMWNKEQNTPANSPSPNPQLSATPAPRPAAPPPVSSRSTTVIGETMRIIGDVHSDEELRLDGAIEEIERFGVDGTSGPMLRHRAVVHTARTSHGLVPRGQREQSILNGDVGREVANLVVVRLIDPAIVHGNPLRVIEARLAAGRTRQREEGGDEKPLHGFTLPLLLLAVPCYATARDCT